MIFTPTKPNQKFLVHMYKENLALNTPQGLIGNKTKPNQILYI